MISEILERTVCELLDQYPESESLFMDNGLADFIDSDIRSSLGRALRLGTALKAGGTDTESFVAQLSEIISNSSTTDPAIHPTNNLNLLALLPCPLKVAFDEAFGRFLDRLPPDQRDGLTFCVEGNANRQVDYADYADHFEDIDEMPDIIITPGFNSFFHPHFVDRFIKSGQFASVSSFSGDEQLSRLGVIDPDGHYGMLAMNLLLLVVNHERLGDRPAPRGWADLLRPEYAKSIAIRGNRDGTFCETLLMTIHKDFGNDALHQLGLNVGWGWHPSQMVKSLSSNQNNEPAICVMPLFFANIIKKRDQISIIWPEDGALVSPVTMLVKTEQRHRLQFLTDFLTGPEVAAICAGASFPALHPDVDNRLPEHAAFKWIGWDYVKNHDLKALIKETNSIFTRSYLSESKSSESCG